MSWKKYCSIESPENAQHMLGDPVWLTEKVDGANFSIHADEFANLAFYSRNQLLHEPYGQFGEAVAIAKRTIIPNIIANRDLWGTTYYFEFYGEGIQRRIPYRSVSKDKRLILIDAKDIEYVVFSALPNIAEAMQVDCVPAFIDHPVDLTVDLINLIRRGEPPFHRSLVAEETAVPEGVVARRVGGGRCPRGNRLICKIKLDEFTNREHKSSKAKKPKSKIPNEVIEFAHRVVDSDRLSSVYSHGDFEPQYAMPDMRHLVTLVPQDIEAEADPIWDQFSHEMIRKAITTRLPVVLKDFLLERLK